jgi:hypothetical protein
MCSVPKDQPHRGAYFWAPVTVRQSLFFGMMTSRVALDEWMRGKLGMRK